MQLGIKKTLGFACAVAAVTLLAPMQQVIAKTTLIKCYGICKSSQGTCKHGYVRVSKKVCLAKNGNTTPPLKTNMEPSNTTMQPGNSNMPSGQPSTNTRPMSSNDVNYNGSSDQTQNQTQAQAANQNWQNQMPASGSDNAQAPSSSGTQTQ